ncbi:MAG: hypothetical protein C6W58_04145 [Bacillaceae bacterium]|uniref:hypothetical protein n=1 Tax=Aeribacillus composti TaxID=1868734 RepID=UPI000E36B63B|nr:MAG: hypothetical protein C6W58_04145 [Bacillaceae bacterium]
MNTLKKIFYDLVQIGQAEGMINGGHQAIDSAAINAYEKNKPKNKQAMQIGEQSLILLAIKSLGLAIKCIFL